MSGTTAHTLAQQQAGQVLWRVLTRAFVVYFVNSLHEPPDLV